MIFWQAGFLLLVLDTVIFFAVADEIGFLKTFFLMVLSALIGGTIVRAQGLATLMKAKESFERGATPVSQIFESLCLLAAGLLLILPGFLSDIIAFALLIPFVRKMLKERGAQAFDLKEEAYRPTSDGVIEGQFERVDEPPERLPPSE